MPGRQLKNPRNGNQAESLAGAILQGIAQTVRVPREEDFGEDYYCSLLQSDGAMVMPGRTFHVQVKKSPFQQWKLSLEHEVSWLLGWPPYPIAPAPLFLARCDLDSHFLELFQLQAVWNIRL